MYNYIDLNIKKVQTVQTNFKENCKLNLKLYSSVFMLANTSRTAVGYFNNLSEFSKSIDKSVN